MARTSRKRTSRRRTTRRTSRRPVRRATRRRSRKRTHRLVMNFAGRRVVVNSKLLKKKTKLKIKEGIELVRDVQPAPQKKFIPFGGFNKLKRRKPGLYRLGEGGWKTLVRLSDNVSLGAAIANNRIAADKSNEYHWLIDVHGGYPVVVRIANTEGKTTYRVEEYAKKLTKELKDVESKVA